MDGLAVLFTYAFAAAIGVLCLSLVAAGVVIFTKGRKPLPIAEKIVAIILILTGALIAIEVFARPQIDATPQQTALSSPQFLDLQPTTARFAPDLRTIGVISAMK